TVMIVLHQFAVDRSYILTDKIHNTFHCATFFVQRFEQSLTHFPYTTLFRSFHPAGHARQSAACAAIAASQIPMFDRVCTTLNMRSEEHTSELQSSENLVCSFLLKKKRNKKNRHF